jgi:hypothetical protein
MVFELQREKFVQGEIGQFFLVILNLMLFSTVFGAFRL